MDLPENCSFVQQKLYCTNEQISWSKFV